MSELDAPVAQLLAVVGCGVAFFFALVVIVNVAPLIRERFRRRLPTFARRRSYSEICDMVFNEEMPHAEALAKRNVRDALWDLRKRLVEVPNGESAWEALHENIVVRMRALDARYDLFNRYSENASAHDRSTADLKLTADTKVLVASIEEAKRSFAPRMTPSVLSAIKGDEARTNAFDPEILAQVARIAAIVDDSLGKLPSGESEAAFTLSEMRRRYIPDTLAIYLDAQHADPIVAHSLLTRQLDDLEEHAQRDRDAIYAGKLVDLRTNGDFLRERLGRSPSIGLRSLEAPGDAR